MKMSFSRCDKPIENHYYPTLHQYLHEAEDGHTETNRPVRYAVDASQFPNFSWRGYAVFSPIQEHVILDVDIPKVRKEASVVGWRESRYSCSSN